MCSVTLLCGHDLMLVRQNRGWCSRACRQRGYRDRQRRRQQAETNQAVATQAIMSACMKLEELRHHLLSLKSGMIQHPINSVVPVLNEALVILHANAHGGQTEA